MIHCCLPNLRSVVQDATYPQQRYSMHFFPGRTYVAIDGANLHSTTKALGVEVDFAKLLAVLGEGTDLLRANYFTAIDESSGVSTIRPFCDYLAYNGYSVVSKPAKSFSGTDGQRRIKGNMDIEIAVDALEMARHYDNYVLMSGDGDFTYLVKSLQRAGKRVIVVSALNQGVLADELRRASDRFVDLSDKTLMARIERVKKDEAA